MTIDELIVAITLDPSKFKKGAKETAETSKKTKDLVTKDSKGIEEQNKKVAESFAGAKKEALGLFAVIIGAKGVADFVGNTTKKFTELNQQARAMGASTQSIAAFGNMVNSALGRGGDAAVQNLGKLTSMMERFKLFGAGDGGVSKEQQRALGAIGARQGDTAIDLERRFSAYAAKINDPKKTEEIGKDLGLGQDEINFALKDGANFANDYAEALKRTPTDDTYKDMEKLLGAFQRFRQELVMDGAAILDKFVPALVHILDTADALAEKFPVATQAIIAFVTAAGALKGLGILGGIAGFASKGGAGAGAAAIGLPEIVALSGVAIGGIALYDTMSKSKKAQAVADNPGQATAAQLAETAAYYQHNLANDPIMLPYFRHKMEDRLNTVQNEMGRRRGPGMPPTGTGSVAQQAYAFFKAKGASDAAAQGIAGGMRAEGGTATAVSPTGAYGAGQWTSDRKARFAKIMGKPLKGSSLQDQLEFMWWEMHNSERSAGSAILGAGSSVDAGEAYINRYMRPPAGNQRQSDLRRLHNSLSGGSLGDASYGGGGDMIKIDRVEINIKSTDPARAGREVRGVLNRRSLTLGANQGLA